MKTILSHKKIYIIILAFLSVMIIIFSLTITKTEAPKVQEAPFIKADDGKILNENLLPNDAEKYIIVSRSVIVPKNILNKSKILLLTIDDGPSARSIEIIKILDKHHAKAIFFINGRNHKKNPGIISQISQAGQAIGNHTWNHLNLKKEKDLTIIESEINKTSKLIHEETGQSPRFFRAPFGESNPYLRKLVENNGMLFMDWSGAVKDWDKTAQEKDIFISNVMSNVHSGSIILIHEHPWSLSNLDALLTTLDAEGYTYVDPNNIIE